MTSRDASNQAIANRRRIAPALNLSLFSLLSIAVALGWTLTLHNADSLIPTLASLDGWQPFYWGQDRFGMLLALLTMPIRDSFWNLVAQNALGVFLLLSGAYAAALRVEVPHAGFAAVGPLAVVLAWPAETTALQVLTTNQSYGSALGLCAMAFALLRPSASWTRLAWGFLAMTLGVWTNAGTGLLVLIVSLLGCASARLRAAAAPALAAAIFGLGTHWVLQATAPGGRVDTSHVSLVTLEMLPATTRAFWSDAYGRFLGPAVVPLALVLVLCVYLERRAAIARSAVLVVTAGSVCYGFAMIALFGGTGRHITPALPLLLATTAIVLARRVPAGSHSLTIALGTIVILQSGVDWPDVGRRRLVARLAEGNAIELFREGVTVVTGDYWKAWPYGFALNMLHERADGTRPVLTVALRGEDLLSRRAAQIREGTKIAVVPSFDYRYWVLRGPTLALATVRVDTDYEVAVVTSTGDSGSATNKPLTNSAP